MVSSKYAFLQALIFSILIFAIGLLVGFYIEGYRIDKIEASVMKSEINILDEQVRNKMIEETDISCDIALQSTFSFADRIYEEAKAMEKYDSVSQFRGLLKTIHPRYDVLRMMVWADALHIKKTCPDDFHTIIYFFEYDTQNVETRAKQTTMARVLTDIKNNYPGTILLIPIAGNLDVESVSLSKDTYGISQLPAILIDENTIFFKVVSYEELEKAIFNKNNTYLSKP